MSSELDIILKRQFVSLTAEGKSGDGISLLFIFLVNVNADFLLPVKHPVLRS